MNKYDKRKNYRPIKITMLEMWFRFSHLGESSFRYRFNIDHRILTNLLNEHKAFDGCIIVESKINNQN